MEDAQKTIGVTLELPLLLQLVAQLLNSVNYLTAKLEIIINILYYFLFQKTSVNYQK